MNEFLIMEKTLHGMRIVDTGSFFSDVSEAINRAKELAEASEFNGTKFVVFRALAGFQVTTTTSVSPISQL